MSVKLADAVAVLYGLAPPDASIGALLDNIDPTRLNRSSPRAEHDEELKVLDALARLCAPAKPGTVLAASMDVTQDVCTVRLAVNSPNDVPNEIIAVLERVWTLLTAYSKDPRRVGNDVDRAAARYDFYAVMLGVCQTEMCIRIQRGLASYKLFVDAFKATTDDAVRGHPRYQGLVTSLTRALEALNIFVKAPKVQRDDKERMMVISAQVFDTQLDGVVGSKTEPFQAVNATFHQEYKEDGPQQNHITSAGLGIKNLTTAREQVAPFDAVQYVSEVLSVPRDIRLLFTFARKHRGCTILDMKLKVFAINGINHDATDPHAKPDMRSSPQAETGGRLGKNLEPASVSSIVRQAFNDLPAWISARARIPEPSTRDALPELLDEATDVKTTEPRDPVGETVDKIVGTFKQLRDCETHAHAENIILDYYLKNPDVKSSGPIGCSKVSCYYCDLYRCAHGGSFYTTGPYDRVYPWHPPAPLPARVEDAIVKEMLMVVGGYVAGTANQIEMLAESTSDSGKNSPTELPVISEEDREEVEMLVKNAAARLGET